MMQKIMLGLALCAVFFLGGCGKVGGPRFWWDDKTQSRLPEDYQLPEEPSAEANVEQERKTVASGEDLTDENLQNYRTDLNLEEEKRKSEASLFDF